MDKKGVNQLYYQTGFRYRVVKYDIVVCCGAVGSSSVPGSGGGSNSSAGGMLRSSAALESGGIPSFSTSGSGAGGTLGSGVRLFSHHPVLSHGCHYWPMFQQPQEGRWFLR